MKIEKSFEIASPRDTVWDAFGDVRFVASCLPGASIAGDLGDGKYKGKFSIKLGPLAASFGGEVSIERNAEQWTATVSGKGTDQRSNSRAHGSMHYRLTGEPGAARTRVDVVSEINLAGALAQFGKANVIQEIAGRLTNEFARNFEKNLSSRHANADETATSPTGTAGADRPGSVSGEAPQALDAGSLLWAIMCGWLRRIFGRERGKAT